MYAMKERIAINHRESRAVVAQKGGTAYVLVLHCSVWQQRSRNSLARTVHGASIIGMSGYLYDLDPQKVAAMFGELANPCSIGIGVQLKTNVHRSCLSHSVATHSDEASRQLMPSRGTHERDHGSLRVAVSAPDTECEGTIRSSTAV
jgi:hypothetical protein